MKGCLYISWYNVLHLVFASSNSCTDSLCSICSIIQSFLQVLQTLPYTSHDVHYNEHSGCKK